MINRRNPEDPVTRLSRVDLSALPADGGENYNRLIFDKSPYLLQHAENPIDWYPWSEQAFEKARAEDKPVFVSIGYSTCHWCHVMAHESFEDTEVAKVLNRHFVAIKVDREERPDLDNTYMAACQMMTGRGGWPLNLILTPGQQPFFAATYIPRNARQGMAGLIDLLEKVAELWLTDRSRLLQTGEEVRRVLADLAESAPKERPISELPLQNAYHNYLTSFDRQHAGFTSAPKFPSPLNLSLLLRIWQRTGEENAKAMALQTLQQIRLGGIYDQLGFGLHRYSVDAEWLVPHFEKMLYDQALLALASLDAFQATNDKFFGQMAGEILLYIRRDLGHPEGGFCCGEDADSKEGEGFFYLWTPEQVRAVLGAETGALFCRCFDVSNGGNFEGRSILRLKESLSDLAQRLELPPDQLAAQLIEARQKLLTAREERSRPHRDDKIVTGWNGLAIAALARAGAILDEQSLVDAARKTADFLLSHLRDQSGRLLRRFRQGEAAIPAFLEDYAFLGWGLIELYMAAFETRYLQAAIELSTQVESLFADGRGGYYDTGADAEQVLGRGRTLQDAVIPCGTSVTAFNLLRLGRLSGDPLWEARGEQLLKTGLGPADHSPSACAQFLIALDYALGPQTEVVLVPGEGNGSPQELLRTLRTRFLPRTLVLLQSASDRELEALVPLMTGKTSVDGKATAYLCRDRSCLEPVTDPEQLARLLAE